MCSHLRDGIVVMLNDCFPSLMTVVPFLFFFSTQDRNCKPMYMLFAVMPLNENSICIKSDNVSAIYHRIYACS